jgi:hypothetical protein
MVYGYFPKVFRSSLFGGYPFWQIVAIAGAAIPGVGERCQKDSPHGAKSPYVTSLLICFQDVLRYMDKARRFPPHRAPSFAGCEFVSLTGMDWGRKETGMDWGRKEWVNKLQLSSIVLSGVFRVDRRGRYSPRLS